MPHLSPMNWFLSPIIFWSLLILMSSFLWWSQSLNFPKLTPSFNYPTVSSWSW